MFSLIKVTEIANDIRRLLGKVAMTNANGSRTVEITEDNEARVSAVVSGSSLPTGAATEAKQDAQTALLTTIDADTGSIAGKDFATQITLAAVLAKLDVALSTRALEAGGNLATIAGKDFATQTTLALMLTALNLMKDTDGIKKITDAVAVTGTFWQATQPVSGTVAVTTLKPDGTNIAPSMDAEARAGWVRQTVGGAGYKSYVDASFVVGDSPVVLDFNDALGRNAMLGYLVCDGAGDISIKIAESAGALGEAIVMKSGEVLSFDNWNLGIDRIEITWISNSAYRCMAK